MKFFLDTANLKEIEEAASLGVIAGVTTNPSLVAKEGHRDFLGMLQEICSLIDGPISAEVVGSTYVEMVQEAMELSALHANIVIKIPMCRDGLKAVHRLTEEGIKTNMTLIFSAQQALLAAQAGARYVSPFVGRLDDIGQDGMQLVSDIVDIFAIHEIETEVIAASIRHIMHVSEAAKAGAHIVTVPTRILEQMIQHPLSEAGIKKFQSDWKAAQRF